MKDDEDRSGDASREDEPGDEVHETDTEARMSEGVEHLQRAAHEMIAAARTFLDVVEEVVGDNAAVSAVADAFGSWSQAMSRAAGRAADDGDTRQGTDGPGGGTGRSRVQHIDLD